MANSEGLHENGALLRPETIDRHRAFTSLQEELEAADWYDQRVDASQDAELGAIMAHNRDEEKEHAMMLLEWLRRRDPTLDAHMRTYLFTDGPITEIEVRAEGRALAAEPSAPSSEDDEPGSLGLGAVRS